MRLEFFKYDPRAEFPKKGTPGSSGYDLVALDTVIIAPGETVIVPLGFGLGGIPRGWEFQVRPRSGMSVETKLRIANSPGTVDSDYRGRIGVIMENTGDRDYLIGAGKKFAQGVFAQVFDAHFVEVETFSDVTVRGTGGYGSTDRKGENA